MVAVQPGCGSAKSTRLMLSVVDTEVAKCYRTLALSDMIPLHPFVTTTSTCLSRLLAGVPSPVVHFKHSKYVVLAATRSWLTLMIPESASSVMVSGFDMKGIPPAHVE